MCARFSFRLFFSTLTLGITAFTACKNDTPPAAPSSQEPAFNLSDVRQVVGIGRVEPEIQIIDLFCQAPGVVQRIFFREGDKIRAGQAMLALDQETEQAKIEKIKAQIQEQEAAVQTVRVDIERARTNAANLKRNYERLQQALAGGAETPQNADNAKNAWELAEIDLRRLQSQIDNTQARIRAFEADLRLAQIELGKRNVQALSNGTLLRLDIAPGATVGTSTKLGEFAPESPLNVVMEVDELFVGKVAVGQKAVIRAQGGSQTLATGTIVEMAPNLKQKSLFSDEIGKLEDRRVREVRIRVDDPPAQPLLYGARVECLIKTSE